MSMKSWPILHSKLLYKLGQDFLDIQYSRTKEAELRGQFDRQLTQVSEARERLQTQLNNLQAALSEFKVSAINMAIYKLK